MAEYIEAGRRCYRISIIRAGHVNHNLRRWLLTWRISMTLPPPTWWRW